MNTYLDIPPDAVAQKTITVECHTWYSPPTHKRKVWVIEPEFRDWLHQNLRGQYRLYPKHKQIGLKTAEAAVLFRMRWH